MLTGAGAGAGAGVGVGVVKTRKFAVKLASTSLESDIRSTPPTRTPRKSPSGM